MIHVSIPMDLLLADQTMVRCQLAVLLVGAVLGVTPLQAQRHKTEVPPAIQDLLSRATETRPASATHSLAPKFSGPRNAVASELLQGLELLELPSEKPTESSQADPSTRATGEPAAVGHVTTPSPSQVTAPPLDAPPLDAPPLDAPPLDAPPLDAPPLDAPASSSGESLSPSFTAAQRTNALPTTTQPTTTQPTRDSPFQATTAKMDAPAMKGLGNRLVSASIPFEYSESNRPSSPIRPTPVQKPALPPVHKRASSQVPPVPAASTIPAEVAKELFATTGRIPVQAFTVTPAESTPFDGGYRIRSGDQLELVFRSTLTDRPNRKELARPSSASPSGRQSGPSSADGWTAGLKHESRQVQVALDGMVQLPMLGAIRAEGLSLDELSREINLAYQHADVEWEVTPLLSQRVGARIYIAGAVMTPGQYGWRNGMNPYDAIRTANGVTRNANLQQVFLFRRNRHHATMATVIDLSKSKQAKGTPPRATLRLRDGDVVLVPSRRVRHVSEAMQLLREQNLSWICSPCSNRTLAASIRRKNH